VNGLDAALLTVRLTVALTILCHAYNHAFGPGGLAGTARWFAGLGMRRPALQAFLSASVEAAAGVGLAVGLFTSIAAAALVGVMVVAGWTAHRPNGFFVFRDGYEYVLVLALVATSIAIAGPGRASVDHALGFDSRLDGWVGLILVAVLGVGGAGGQLATFWRPPANARLAKTIRISRDDQHAIEMAEAQAEIDRLREELAIRTRDWQDGLEIDTQIKAERDEARAALAAARARLAGLETADADESAREQ
jgi:putative oxidoreductase